MENKLKILWIPIISLVLISLAWLMQAYSLIDWENAVKLGLQFNSFNGSDVNKAIAVTERGINIADMIWPLPLTIIAFVGIAHRKFYGLITGFMVYAICVYFPLFTFFQVMNENIGAGIFTIVMWAIPSLISIIILWQHRNEFK